MIFGQKIYNLMSRKLAKNGINSSAKIYSKASIKPLTADGQSTTTFSSFLGLSNEPNCIRPSIIFVTFLSHLHGQKRCTVLLGRFER